MSNLKLQKGLRHLAIIMDGNARWAKERGKPAEFGHKSAVDTLLNSIDEFLEKKIPYVSLYLFSTENWKRDTLEIDSYFNLFDISLKKNSSLLKKKGVRIHFSGTKERLNNSTICIMDKVLKETINNTRIVVNFCFNYGSREEIVYACKKWAATLSEEPEKRLSEIESFSEEKFSQYLDTASLPDVDLLIRTGGDYRLSNFLLYQLSYAELYFTNTYWPDWNNKELTEAIEVFNSRCRRFGGRDV